MAATFDDRPNDYPMLTQPRLDAMMEVMDATICEDLHTAADWQHPGEFLTAYLLRDPKFPVHQFTREA